DNHLRSNHFFPTQDNHKITFLTKQINQNQLLAHFTIKPQTHQHTFHLQFNPLTKNPINPHQLTPFILSPTINPQKYAINFNQPLQTPPLILAKNLEFQPSPEFTIHN
uniref:YceI family protein n=1 Tax=Staphylococcus epidermidis TaxID=1282 RepID=UPI001C92CF00